MTPPRTLPPLLYQVGDRVSTPDGPGVIQALTPDYSYTPLQPGSGYGRRCYLWNGLAVDGPFVVLVEEGQVRQIRGYTYDQLRLKRKEESSP